MLIEEIHLKLAENKYLKIDLSDDIEDIIIGLTGYIISNKNEIIEKGKNTSSYYIIYSGIVIDELNIFSDIFTIRINRPQKLKYEDKIFVKIENSNELIPLDNFIQISKMSGDFHKVVNSDCMHIKTKDKGINIAINYTTNRKGTTFNYIEIAVFKNT